MRIGFIGFGKLGQPCGEVISEKGHDVVAYDVADVDTTVEMKDSTKGMLAGYSKSPPNQWSASV